MAYRQSEKRALLMDASVANWWNEEEYAVDINEEDYLISIESVDHSITTRAKYEKRYASSDINDRGRVDHARREQTEQREEARVMQMLGASGHWEKSMDTEDVDGEGEEEEEWRQDEAGQAVETYAHARRRTLACSDY
jgi:hypothetical protein